MVIVEDERRAVEIAENINALEPDRGEVFPELEVNFFNIKPLEDAHQHQRLRVLQRLLDKDIFVVVTTLNALRRKTSTPAFIKKNSRKITLDSEIEIEELTQYLVEVGYEKVYMVESNGQFSIRGGIVDVYPIGYDEPIRLDLFGDEIDSMRSFDIQTQRSVANLKDFRLFPARELILTDRQKRDIASSIEKDIEKYRDHPLYGGNAQKAVDKYGTILGLLQEDILLPNSDLVSVYLRKNTYGTLLSYFDDSTIIFMEDMSRIYDAATESDRIFLESAMGYMEEGEIFLTQVERDILLKNVIAQIKTHPLINVTQLMKRTRLLNPKSIFKFSTSETESYNRNVVAFIEGVKQLIYKGHKIIIFGGKREESLKLQELLASHDIYSKWTQSLDETIQSNQVIVYASSYKKGFEYPEIKMTVITQREMYGIEKRKKKSSRKKTPRDIINYSDLSIGDYIVHESHGIGQYQGIQKIEVQGIAKDYLVIQYRGKDKLFIPTEQMNLIQKYIGGEGVKPRMSTLGGSDWSKAKQRAKKAADEIASDLVELYAKRQKQKGFAFSEDTPWQKEFEEFFIYEETYSQLRSVEEIKRDMESDKPMDRLLCGDVGYGKTEVALRAIFKAVMDGKQVAFLVPTTILAQQHYYTMLDRFKDFPVKVEMISRFRTPAQQQGILRDVRKGFIDVLIGTHRILSRDLQFKDLGLLIVDEEQRFGVRHKEKLKSLKENIDVLTLSATPIPRTLQMGLVGIRDMSTLDEPPEERFPITTYVMEYDDGIIKNAINKEINRGGQVYFVYNRVRDIERMAERLQAILPDAKIIIGHGQMTERTLENVMIDFNEGEYDILLCTTIIETGLDIQNVNTMIVYDADKMGLSQLYQLKGRIGRSDRSSSAYFTYEKGKVLSEISEKRLMAIRDFTEFGSGFKIAMRDLELRGAGNMLGESQHGHIEAVGYDLYVKLLEESILESKGESVRKSPGISIEIRVDGYIPNEYIPDQDQKIDMYKKIASIETIEDFDEIIEELIDRYGDIPKPVLNIVRISTIKALAQSAGFTGVREDKEYVILEYDDPNRFSFEDIHSIVEEFQGHLEFDLSKNPSFKLKYEREKLKETVDLVYIIYCLQKKLDENGGKK